jgi:hypothetical protein
LVRRKGGARGRGGGRTRAAVTEVGGGRRTDLAERSLSSSIHISRHPILRSAASSFSSCDVNGNRSRQCRIPRWAHEYQIVTRVGRVRVYMYSYCTALDFYWTSPHAHTHSIFVTSCRGERGTKDRPIATRVRQLLPRHDGLSRCRSPQVQRVLIRCSRKRLATLLDTFSPTSPIRAYSYSNPSEHRHMGKKGTYLGNCFRVPCLRPIQQKERGGCRHDRIRFWTKSPARKVRTKLFKQRSWRQIVTDSNHVRHCTV